ncbi:hypothetical protein J7I94_19130 [Streptomyces sp. ISL-12]|uniref:hypothetical protein n=1 Tax=Streptomyces sp. ISL-12 TaxID=2819177 RepID=UPI001BE6D723|nr:hypothetical protein [Streptomyces sp. ISL-12]MBT2412648.1 hypothetical protein [Streptomyces sp. ISL-12]
MALTVYLSILRIRLREKLRAFAAQEPVRLRAALTSLVMLGAVFAPDLAQENIAATIGGVAAVVLPILVGESARRKVSPAE